MKNKKLTTDLKLLISIAGLRYIADLFFGTFLVSFIMHLAKNEILAVSTYKLFDYAATCAGFFLFAHWCKRRNKVAAFRLSLVPQVVLLIMIIMLGNQVAEYVIPIGIIYGIGASMYHLPSNMMMSEKTTPDTANKFIGIKNTVTYIVKITAPIVLGFFIDTGSYTEMAYAMLVLTGG